MKKKPKNEVGNPRLRRAFLDIVQNQLRVNTPPETKETLDRLLREGYSRKRALEMIACIDQTRRGIFLRQWRVFACRRYRSAPL